MKPVSLNRRDRTPVARPFPSKVADPFSAVLYLKMARANANWHKVKEKDRGALAHFAVSSGERGCVQVTIFHNRKGRTFARQADRLMEGGWLFPFHTKKRKTRTHFWVQLTLPRGIPKERLSIPRETL